MYPFARLALNLFHARRQPTIGFWDPLETRHRCSPFDCDMFGEMNNGRILTLYEFGRFQHVVRTGFWPQLKAQGWGLAVAGASVRYRKRIVPFERFTQKTRMLGWDERFVYIEQAMIKTSGEVANHCLFRTAVVANHRAVPTSELARVAGLDPVSPQLPDWALNWTTAEATRPWPPMQAAEDVAASVPRAG
ncbi:acyl-CoA thioesterase [Shimia ponticola]|uniref:acyl-CoA thioesterase n=1 Tax=Shimia ponticola TaxID=2582893 RepID=UPI0011BFDEB8|nr:acyl-CoA thioesterase [Shimia ponticola]